jgi:hypothetical protein
MTVKKIHVGVAFIVENSKVARTFEYLRKYTTGSEIDATPAIVNSDNTHSTIAVDIKAGYLSFLALMYFIEEKLPTFVNNVNKN